MMKTLARQQNGILGVIAQMTGNAPVTTQPQNDEKYDTLENYSFTIDPIDEEQQMYTSGNLTPGEEIDCDVEEESSDDVITEDAVAEKKEDYTDPMFYNLPK